MGLPAEPAYRVFVPLLQQGGANVRSWVYQLSSYQNNRLDQIAGSRFDLAVVDLARDGGGDYFTAGEVAALTSSGKVALAYFEIGAIEDYRPEWSQVPADLKLGAVGGWPSEQYVKYWDERWWPIVRGRVDQALAAGFDGAYLDMVVTYEEIPANAGGTNREDLAGKMVDLIAGSPSMPRAMAPTSRSCRRIALNCAPGRSTCRRSMVWAWRSCTSKLPITRAARVGARTTGPMRLRSAPPASWC